MEANEELRAMSTEDSIQYFKKQKESLEKKLGTNFDSMKTFKLYQKIINDAKSINSDIKVDFSYVSKDTPKGTMKTLFTSKKFAKSKSYEIANTFIIKNNKFLKLAEYTTLDDVQKPFVREAGERDMMNIDDTIVKALRSSLNNDNENSQTPAQTPARR